MKAISKINVVNSAYINSKQNKNKNRYKREILYFFKYFVTNNI